MYNKRAEWERRRKAEKGGENMATIFFIIYSIAGYWATGKTIYANKVVIYSGNTFFMRRMVFGIFFGYVLIPAAIIKTLLMR
jgi:hypothetical protein